MRPWKEYLTDDGWVRDFQETVLRYPELFGTPYKTVLTASSEPQRRAAESSFRENRIGMFEGYDNLPWSAPVIVRDGSTEGLVAKLASLGVKFRAFRPYEEKKHYGPVTVV